MDDDETYEIDEADTGVIDTPDGGAIVTLDEDGSLTDDEEHFSNLAETLPDDEMNRLATTLLELIERDKEARKKRDEQYEEGIRRTGLGDDAPGGAKFSGASKVVHPMLVEATIDFEARAMKELWPAGGPAKSYVPGDPTEERLEKAERKARLLNWQLTVQCQNARAEIEQLLVQLPLGGSQYLKLWWDDKRNRPEFLFVPIDDMYLPFAATNFYTAQRRTHVQYVTQLEYESRVEAGMYRDVDLPKPGMEPEQSGAAKASDKVEGRESTAYNEDGLRAIYECYVTAEIDGETAPYIVSIDVTSRTVLSVYRNWAEEDDSKEELQWFVEFAFVPWRGAYAIGLPHMIGGLSAAATGALRALLDSAHINNVPSGIKLKSKMGGQNLTLQPTQIGDVEGSAMVDDIRKLYMPLPFNPPSATLFELLGFIVDAGHSVVQTTFENLADQGTAPVGTTVALIEQGMVVYSAIHERCHDAFARMLRILNRLNGDNLDESAVVDEAGQLLARRGDFSGPLDVVPVSDPRIFSETQRFAQASTVVQRAALVPDLYDRRESEQYFLETLHIPNADRFLVPNMDPKEENAVRENVLASIGKPLVAMPRQDHIAHLKAHIAYMMSPMLGMSSLIAPKALPVLLDHLSQHVAMWYAAMTYELVKRVSGIDVEKERKMVRSSADRQAFDRMLSEAATLVVEEAATAFAALPEAIQQAQQLMQQMQQAQTSGDPIAVAMADVKRKEASDQQKAQIDTQNLKLEAMRDQLDAMNREKDRDAETAREQLRQQGESQRAAENNQSREGMNDADNSTAIELAGMEIVSKEQIAKAQDFGPNPDHNPNQDFNPDHNPKP